VTLAEKMTDENRRRLTALVAARAKLEAAASLVKEATVNIARSGLLPRDRAQEIAAEIDAYVQRVAAAIEHIP
jgi:hypothetical protein